MSGVSFKVDTAEIGRAWAQAPEVMLEHLSAGVLEGLFLLQRETVERTPRTHSTLANSILAQPLELQGSTIVGTMGTALVYAEPVETGSRPHWAPLPALLAWVKAKGLQPRKGQTQEDVARAVQRKIGFHGTKGAFMFQRAMQESEKELARILDAAAARGIEAIAGLA